ncbi:autotransporter-associated beta strand repeat-containing protein [Luteolibacter arcticus]|uniref:Autotransporter-associated beta strand repeat-containing protein n=1 Tax=Luteolibacter arcticus TaxID=1581411 RepID=A0ABT3GF88_9BACT|nr:autotransporter-associated beta strand repeat-containing protein [Luteolibacter arcticus]MCW1922267.1 autotransporter-associated beta strand repeat-containing protein [Luteolibacter arcticus]
MKQPTTTTLHRLALCAGLALAPQAHAAPVIKSATGTDLATGASWGGTAPTGTDTATWNASSLGDGLTLNSSAAWNGLAVTGATAPVSISGAGMLSLGSGGLDLSTSPVNLTIGHPVELAAAQTWKVASGRTITSSGVISGSGALTIGSTGQLVTTTTFLTNTAQTLFPNTSLAGVTSAGGKIGGGWVGAGTPVNASGYLLTNNGTTASFWLQAVDGGFTKGVRVELAQSGADITARSTAAKNVSGSNLGFNFDTGGATSPLATVQTGDGYGAHTTTLQVGADTTGTLVFSGLNTYTGATSVTRGILRAGISSVAGSGGAFGNESAVSLANAASTGLDLNGFDTLVGSLTGGGTVGGGITLGAATLTTGGDNSSPAAYAGVIGGTGGVVKTGSGTQILSGANTYSGGTIVSGSGTLTGSAGVAFTGTQGGAFGTGAITVNSGATLRATTPFVIGGGQNTTRVLNLNGGTANLQGGGTGGEYLKTINLTGGSMSIDSGTVYFRAPTGGTALHSFAAPVASTIATGIDLTLGHLTVDAAAGTVPDGHDLVISGNISQNTGAGSGAKTLTKTGTGTLVLAGSNNSYTGVTTVSAGTLVVNGTLATAAGSVEVGATGTLDGAGTINRPVNLAAGSVITPAGATIGTLTVGGTVTLQGTTVLQIHKDSGSGLTQDLLDADAVNFGGTLEVTATGDALALGDSFLLFDAATYGGGFTSFSLPALAGGLSWDFGGLASSGILTVVNYVSTPAFSPSGGGFAGTPSVTITSESGATIHYTVNGSTPTAASPVYAGPIMLPANTATFTLKAFAKKAGKADSPVTTGVYHTIDTPTWITNGDAYWGSQPGDEANWQNMVIAGGSGASANFSSLALTQSTTVTLDGSRVIGHLAFGDASPSPTSDWSLIPQSGSMLTLATDTGTPSITVNNQTTTISAPVAGTQGFTKSGAGTLKLAGSQSYTGDTVVNAGSLLLDSSAVASNTPQIASEKIVNNSAVTFLRAATGFTHINPSLSGAGDYFVDGPGGGGVYDNRVAFRGTASDNTGTIHLINGGRLWVDAAGANAIGDSAIVDVGATASFHIYRGVTETIGGLQGSGEVWGRDSLTTPVATLVVGGGDKTASFSGVLKQDVTPLAITKIGTGTQTFAGTNTYTGATTVEGGRLAGTGAIGSDVTVKSGATLAPGAGVGTMDAKALTFETGSTLQVEVNSTSGTADKVVAHGAVSLTGVTADFTEVGSGTVAAGTKLVILDYTGQSLTGIFTGLAEGASVVIGANSFTLSYADSSRVTLTIPGGGFSSWAAANAPGQTMAMDHDHDGVANGIEYFMGVNGSAFTANPAMNAARLISWPKGAGYTGVYGTDYVVQTSINLTTWDDVLVGDVVIESDSVDYTLPTGGSPKFMRLKVTGP